MSDVSELTFLKSFKGMDQLVHNGFIFQYERENNGKRIWSCILNHKVDCRGRVHTVGATVKEIKEHNHEPDKDEIIVRRCFNEIIEQANNEPEDPKILYVYKKLPDGFRRGVGRID
ncbi:hypothetical protein DMENIID0001_088760 [Sergentomyia squamirostris]